MDVTIEAALLEWVNRCHLHGAAKDLSTLSNGEKIWEALHDIDTTYFTGSLPESTENARKTWWSRWENLKYIHEILVRFLNEDDKEGVPKTLPSPDLKAIAMESDAKNSVELLKLVLVAAIHGPRAQEHVGRMLKLSVPTQGLLMEMIKEMGEVSEEEVNGIDLKNDGPLSPALNLDPELQFEERCSKILTENDVLKKDKRGLQHELESLEERFNRLQQSNASLKERMSKAEDRLIKDDSAQNGNGSTKLMEHKFQQQVELIASLEDDLAESKSNKEAMKRTIEKLRDSSKIAQTLQDQLDVVKADRDGLAKKANAAEKYKQKIHASQDLQKENFELRQELTEIRQLYQEAEQARQQVPGLQRAVEDYKQVLEKVEQEHYELQRMKKQLEFDNKALASRWDEANARHIRDQESIADLTDKLRMLGESSPPATPAPGEDGGLESELTAHGENEQRLQSRLVEQRKENQRLQSVKGELEGELNHARQILGDVRVGHEEREKLHLATYEKMLTLQSSLAAVQQGCNIRDTESYQIIWDKLDEEQRLRAKLHLELKSTRKELEISRQDLNLVDKDKRTVLEGVRKHQSAELANLQEENKSLRSNLLNVETDLAGHRKLLHNNISSNIKPAANEAYSHEILTAMKSIKDAVTDRPAISLEDLEKTVAALGEKVMKSNAALAKREERIKKQDAELQELRISLQRQIDSETLSPPPPQESTTRTKNFNKAKEEEEGGGDARLIANLERENRLMASAYHSLAGRLQMNNVVLQRRNEMPNSWLSKQRQLVDQQIPLPGR